MKQEIIFKAYSFYKILESLLVRFVALIVGIYAYAHFDENPVVISIVMLISFLTIILIGSPEVIVYSDRIVKSNDSFLSLLTSKSTYYFKDIDEAYFESHSTVQPNLAEIGVIKLLGLILPKRHSRPKPEANPVLLKMNNGSTTNLVSDFNQQLKDKLVAEINNAKGAAANMGFAKVGQ